MGLCQGRLGFSLFQRLWRVLELLAETGGCESKPIEIGGLSDASEAHLRP